MGFRGGGRMEPGCREGDGHTLGAEGGRAPTGASLSAASKSFSLSVQLYISILSGRCIFVSAQAFKSHTTAGLRKNCQVPGGNVWSHRAQPRIPSILCIPPLPPPCTRKHPLASSRRSQTHGWLSPAKTKRPSCLLVALQLGQHLS